MPPPTINVVPFVAMAVVLALFAAVFAIARVVNGSSSETENLPEVSRENRCPSCDYDLRAATDDRCPECGLVTTRFRRVGLDLAKLSERWPEETLEPPTTPPGTAAASLFVAPSSTIAALATDQLRARGIDARQTIVRVTRRTGAYGVFATHDLPLGVDVPAADLERAEAILADFANG